MTNPFPGLAPFDEQDAARFFGRDAEIEEILDRLATRRLLAVIGVSGCGKSSLVRAGVIPVLRIGAAENLPGRWRIHTIKPGNAPLEALRKTLDAPATWPSTSFDFVELAKASLKPDEKLLLIVDQFEELFTYRAETLEKDAGNTAALFVNLLLNAVDQRQVPIYVLLTMRTDFLGECAQFRGLPEALNDCYYLVPRMTRTQQQEAIERPLEEDGVEIAPALVQRLLNDSAEDPDHLPVLQHLLKRLWESWELRGASGPIGDEEYKAVGGWKKAIKQDANAVLFKFWGDVDGIERVFRWITDRGTGERPIRRPRPFAECAEVSGLAPERLGEIVKAFQDRGLLRHSELLDLQHESVMWQWEELAAWINQEAEYAAQLRFLLQSARQKVPLVGLALVSALKLRGATRLRYLRKQELEEIDSWVRRSRRRQLWFWVGIGAIGLLLIWISITSVRQRNLAEARELSAWSIAALREDPERGLILGLYAWEKQHLLTTSLEASLHEALLQSQVRRTLLDHTRNVLGVSWSPDGRKVATASQDQTVKIWLAATGQELLSLPHQSEVLDVAWSPDGTKIATAVLDATARIWQAGTGRELLTLSHHLGVAGVSWSPNGMRLATAGIDKTVKIWDASAGRELFTLSGHEGVVWRSAWSPDGSKLATASFDKTAKVWDVRSGRELLSLSHQHEVVGVAWSPDGRRIATAGHDYVDKVWTADTGREVITLNNQTHSTSVAWSPDGTKLAIGGGDGTAKVWAADTGRELLTLRGHFGAVFGIAWSPDSSKLATGGNDRTARIWDAEVGSELLSLSGQPAIWSVAWSPDGSKLATAGNDKTARVWEAVSGRCLLSISGHQDYVRSVAWSPDGKKIATGSADGTAKIWEVGTGRGLLFIGGHQAPIWSVAWSPDGSKLATAGDDKTARVWQVSTGRQLLVLENHEKAVVSLAWSPDGRKLATGSQDFTAVVWDVSTGRYLFTLVGQNSVASIAWSPDGMKIATCIGDNTAKVWEAGTGRYLLSLVGHQAAVNSVVWSPDGSELATGSTDKTAKVWDSRTGGELVTLRIQQGAVTGVAWSPDGKKLAAASADGIVQIYAIDHNLLLNLVRSRITRDLTPEECRRYLNSDRCPPLPRVP